MKLIILSLFLLVLELQILKLLPIILHLSLLFNFIIYSSFIYYYLFVLISFIGTNKIRGSMRKWITQFNEINVLVFLIDLNSSHDYFQNFDIVLQNCTVLTCYYIYLIGLFY